MKSEELASIIIAILVLAIVIGFKSILNLNVTAIGYALLFAFLIIAVNILAKKWTASLLDAGVEQKIWFWSRYGFAPKKKLKREVPLGIILPLFIAAFFLGTVKVMSILSYETTALKKRAAKRFGPYSFTEMTDKHIALIGAAGIVAVLVLSFIAYLIDPISSLAKMAAFYAFWNMIPFSKLDGIQIYFGSRILWTILAIITLIVTSYALLLP